MNFFKWTLINWIGGGVFEKKNSPFEYFCFPLKGYMIKKYLNNKRFKYNEEERENIKKLMLYFID